MTEDLVVEDVAAFVYPLIQGDRVYFCLEVLTAVPLSRVIWNHDLSAPKNMGPLVKLSRV